MKKKMVSIFMTLVMLFTLVGCSQNANNYKEAINKVVEWEGNESESNIDIAMTIVSNGEKHEIKLPIEIKGKSIGGTKGEADVKVNLKDVKSARQDLKSLPESIETKIFVNDGKIYINKDFIVSTFGDKVPEKLAKIDEEYISYPISASDDVNYVQMVEKVNSTEYKEKVINLVEELIKGFEPTQTIQHKSEENGIETYIYENDIQGLSKDAKNIIEKFIENSDKNNAKIIEALQEIGMKVNAEQIQQLKNSYNKETVEKQIAEATESLKGSKISVKESFGKDILKEDFELVINDVKGFKMNLKSNSVAKRVKDVKIEMPTSVKNLTMEEYMGLFMPDMSSKEPIIMVALNGELINFKDVQPTIVNDRTLVPFRALLEKMGAEVEWNAEEKSVVSKMNGQDIKLVIDSDKAILNGQEVTLDAPAMIKDGRTMIPLRFVSENLGYKVNFQNINGIYSIEISK